MPDDLLSDLFDRPPTPVIPRRRQPTDYNDIIERHSKRTGLDPNLVRSVIGQESSGSPTAVSPKGARGLMQLMPATAQRFGVKNVNDPEENIRGGTDYLKFLSDRYNGDIDKVLAGYNAGEGAVDKFGGVPPYKETRAYVPAIKARYQKLTGQTVQSTPAKPRDPLSDLMEDPLTDLFDKTSGQTPQPKPNQSATIPPRAPSVPIEQALAKVTQQTNRIMRRRGIPTEPQPQPPPYEVIDAGNAEPVDLP